MRLPTESVQYAKFDPTPPTSDALQVHLLGQWRDLTPGAENDEGEWTPDPEGTVHAIRVAGPDVTPAPPGALVLPFGEHPTKVRRAESMETLVCRTDPIRVIVI